MNNYLEVDWDDLHQSCSLEEFPSTFNNKVLEASKKCITDDKQGTKQKLSLSQRKRRSLIKKKKRVQKIYNKRILSNPTSLVLFQLNKQIESLDMQIKSTIRSELEKEEQHAIQSLTLTTPGFLDP